jgi:myosin heavy chain 6/7
MSGFIDPRDPEVIESLKFLLVPKEDRIKMSAMPFDAKKACWVPDHNEGFIAGEITGSDKDNHTVKTSKGEVKQK